MVFVVQGITESGDHWTLVFDGHPSDERVRAELWETMPYEMRHETQGAWTKTAHEVIPHAN